MTRAFEFFENGCLFDAVQAATEEVKRAPTDVDLRCELIDYLCFEGNLERAEIHIQAVQQAAPDLAGEMLVYRNLLRGETARRQCFEDGRLPAFTEQPSAEMQNVLKAYTLLDEDPAAASDILQSVISHQAEIRGECDDEEFLGFRDWNELTPDFFEMITCNGDYYWIPFEHLRVVRFEELACPRDVIWRPTELTTKDHETVTAYVPGLYHGTSKSNDDALRLGRAASWIQNENEPTRGVGGRTFLVGHESKPMALIRQLRFESFEKQP